MLIGDVFSCLYSLSRILIFLCLCLLYFTFFLVKCFSFVAQFYNELCCNLRRDQRWDADQVMQLRLNP